MTVEPIGLGQAAPALVSPWRKSELPQLAQLANREKPGEAPCLHAGSAVQGDREPPHWPEPHLVHGQPAARAASRPLTAGC
jgi:hypothetical protein